MAPIVVSTTVQVVAAVAALVAALTTCSPMSAVPRNTSFTCDLNNSSSCDVGECCVKKVSWRLEDTTAAVEVSTECQPLLAAEELCLLQPQGYVCQCGPGLQCRAKHGEDFGHCAKA